MKKKILYRGIALVIIIVIVISFICLYKKYTVRFSPVSLKELELEPLDFLPSRTESESASTMK